MRALPLLFSLPLLCGCVPTSGPVAHAPSGSCTQAFDAIAPAHAIANTDAAYAAVSFACEYARAETRALSLCEAPFPTHSLVRDPLGAADYRLRKRTLTALMDAELFGEKLAQKDEADRIASGGPAKTERGCYIVFDQFPQMLALREDALLALSESGRY